MSKGIKEKDKLGKFYNFEVSEERLRNVEKLTKKAIFKHFRNAFILGFAVELLITQTKICNLHFDHIKFIDENIVKSATMKRLGEHIFNDL